jgi:anti-sigma regulatory factor (Ser/Thr protein kinase)
MDDLNFIALPYTLDAPALARQYLRTHAQHLPPAKLDDALILISELVTNAVQHGQPPITFTGSFNPAHVEVAVTDHGPGTPTASPASQHGEGHGRGLQIVADLSTRWGVMPAGDFGKTVWFCLDQSPQTS